MNDQVSDASSDASSDEPGQSGDARTGTCCDRNALGIPPDVRAGPPFAWRLPAIMRRHIYTGAMGHSYGHLLGGMLLVAYGREIGVSYRAWGIMAALSSFTVLFQLVSAHLTEQIGHRRAIWFACAMAERLARGLAIVAAYHLSGGDPIFTSAVFVGLIAVANAFSAMATPPWWSWLADLIPADRHGLFWGRRSAWIALVVISVFLPSAYLVDVATDRGLRMPAMLTVFALGLFLGYTDLFIHRTIPEPPAKAGNRRGLRAELATVLRDRLFRPWLAFRCAWNFSMSLGGSMMTIYFLENLGFRNRLAAAALFVVIVPLLSQLAGGRYVGGLVDRLGTRPVLACSHVVWSFTPMFWFFVTRDTSIWWPVAWQLVSGLATSSAENAGSKLVTRLPRREDCAMYLAVSNCLVHVASGLGALAAGEVLTFLEGMSWDLGGLTLDGFHILYLVSTFLRLASTALTRLLPTPEAERDRILNGNRGSSRLVSPNRCASAPARKGAGASTLARASDPDAAPTGS